MMKGLKLAGIALAVIFGIFALLAIWQWDTVRFVLDNYETLQEGEEWAEQLEEPEDLLAYIDANRQKVALHAIRLDEPEQEIRWRSGEFQPLASTYKLLVLAEIARQIEDGRLDPDQMAAVEEIEALHLPGTDGDAHRRAFNRFEEEGLIRRGNIALRDVIRAMVQWSDNAATDYLIRKVGRENLQDLVETIEPEGVELPFPINGAFLLWQHHEMDTDAEERLAEYRQWDRGQVHNEAYAMSDRMAGDEEFRETEQERLEGSRLDLDLVTQRAMSMTLTPVGTAEAYAEIMRSVFLGNFISSEVSGRMQEYLEWPMTHERIHQDFTRYGTKAGSLPGVLTSAIYGRAHDGTPVMISLLFQDLQFAVWFQFMRQQIQQEFEFLLMKDEEFWTTVKEFIDDLEE